MAKTKEQFKPISSHKIFILNTVIRLVIPPFPKKFFLKFRERGDKDRQKKQKKHHPIFLLKIIILYCI